MLKQKGQVEIFTSLISFCVKFQARFQQIKYIIWQLKCFRQFVIYLNFIFSNDVIVAKCHAFTKQYKLTGQLLCLSTISVFELENAMNSINTSRLLIMTVSYTNDYPIEHIDFGPIFAKFCISKQDQGIYNEIRSVIAF